MVVSKTFDVKSMVGRWAAVEAIDVAVVIDADVVMGEVAVSLFESVEMVGGRGDGRLHLGFVMREKCLG